MQSSQSSTTTVTVQKATSSVKPSSSDKLRPRTLSTLHGTVTAVKNNSKKPVDTSSPDKDWELLYRKPTSTGHHVRESPAERQEKHALVRNVLDSAPQTPINIDAARLKNVLLELNVHFRVAALLPVLLDCTMPEQELEFLGEDVNRTLALIRLQTELAVNILNNADPLANMSSSTLLSADHSLDTVDSSVNDNSISVAEEQESREERLKRRLSLAATSTLFSFKETFFALCVAFRNTCDYDLLVKAEKVFSGQLAKVTILPVIRDLCQLTADMMHILLNAIETTPFESCEVQKVIAQMTERNVAAEGKMKNLWDDFKKNLDENREEHERLSKTIEKNQAIITSRLRELHEVRLKAQTRIHRQAEDDNGPHRHKMVKMITDTVETQKLVDERNKQYLRHEKDYLKQIRDAKATQRNLEISVLERCVGLKSEIMALQDRGEVLREHLRKNMVEEKQLEEEMNIMLQDRRERDERRRIAEAEALRRNQAATIIQKWFRGYIVRKRLKKKKKKGKKKGKGKSKDGKKDKAASGGAKKAKPASAKKKK
ncbi:hypothetical protein BV898_06430 [Hypsibius exemplaris]|uniref:Dynein regulatory complex protein 10 n=1 Tax=Hypsibius exemplaris TaxID=2072580 RepID=A0A1W0WWU1_HYPEX|nr:hypothetical protein BV898_06430 [Hypsibius exemplaris]